MTEEVQVLAEADSVPVQAATAAPETEVQSLETDTPEPQPEEKKFSQAELDAMITKRLAKEQRKWEREQQSKPVKQAVPNETPPSVDQFESPEAYAEALAVRKAEELIDQRERQKEQAAIRDAYADREEQARKSMMTSNKSRTTRTCQLRTSWRRRFKGLMLGQRWRTTSGPMSRKPPAFLVCRPTCRPKRLGRSKPDWLTVRPSNDLRQRPRLSHLSQREAATTRLTTRLTHAPSRA